MLHFKIVLRNNYGFVRCKLWWFIWKKLTESNILLYRFLWLHRFHKISFNMLLWCSFDKFLKLLIFLIILADFSNIFLILFRFLTFLAILFFFLIWIILKIKKLFLLILNLPIFLKNYFLLLLISMQKFLFF